MSKSKTLSIVWGIISIVVGFLFGCEIAFSYLLDGLSRSSVKLLVFVAIITSAIFFLLRRKKWPSILLNSIALFYFLLVIANIILIMGFDTPLWFMLPLDSHCRMTSRCGYLIGVDCYSYYADNPSYFYVNILTRKIVSNCPYRNSASDSMGKNCPPSGWSCLDKIKKYGPIKPLLLPDD